MPGPIGSATEFLRMSSGYNSESLSFPAATRQYPMTQVPRMSSSDITLELHRFWAQQSKILWRRVLDFKEFKSYIRKKFCLFVFLLYNNLINFPFEKTKQKHGNRDKNKGGPLPPPPQYITIHLQTLNSRNKIFPTRAGVVCPKFGHPVQTLDWLKA